MGINQLNKFIRGKCNNDHKHDAITPISLRNLAGKKIVIDTSIYMYKYAKDNHIIEGMFSMISTLLHYNITPIFIFDGKPPIEKDKLIAERRVKKKNAEKKYNKLKQDLTLLGKSQMYINNNKQLQKYKKECTRIKWYNIVDIKEMMRFFGVEYHEAEQEADKLCASMVIGGYAWACLSEDTDLFVYGCPRILRYISFMTNKVVLYNLSHILKILNISQKVFTQLCVLTGTDYNTGVSDIYILYNEYENYRKNNSSLSFCNWIVKNKVCTSLDIQEYINIHKMFLVEPYNCANKKTLTPPDYSSLKKFLETFNFIFINNELSVPNET